MGDAGTTENTGPRWEVWRQDDNGNRYLVSAHPDEPAARRRLAELESGVMHKQTYWISRTPR